MKNTFTQLNLFVLLLLAVSITFTVRAQTHTMAAGVYSLSGTVTYYDPGGAGGGACPSAMAGNYSNNLNITETITANPGQLLVVTWTGGLFGIASGDVLTVYNGPDTGSPVLATYNGTTNPIPAVIGPTTSNSITFRFTSNSFDNCKGWQATISAYYFMQNGGFTFSCPGTYTFLDNQSANSGGPGGDATCVSFGNTKNYQDVSLIETFSTTNGNCILVDGSFPNNFGICSGDTLKVFNGPSMFSPITAVYTNTFTNPGLLSIGSSSVTFQFISDAGNHARGWQLKLSCTPPPTSTNAAISANGPTTFCHNDSVVLTVASQGFLYQWKKGNTILAGATQQHFTAKQSGNYKCNVSNSCGSITSNTISVTQNPLPTASISQAACVNSSVLLTCNFSPPTGVTFIWKKGGVIIAGATDSTYTATQNGTYRCVVTNTATGCTKKSSGSSVTITCKSGDRLNDNDAIVYPNPASNYFNINTAQLDQHSALYIYDLTGRKVESHTVSGYEMKVGETLANGVYFLKIELNHETQQVIKLVKNR